MKISLAFNTRNSLFKVSKAAKNANELTQMIQKISELDSDKSISVIKDLKFEQLFAIGYFYGSLKANFDCLPGSIAQRQQIQGIPLAMFIKETIREQVISVRKHHKVDNFVNFGEGYLNAYRKLSCHFCGYGSNVELNKREFHMFFPSLSYRFVEGFVKGYSDTLHEMAIQADVILMATDPLLQDLWKNFSYFLNPGTFNYSLDGYYLFPYVGYFEDQPGVYERIGFNINNTAYEELKSRDVSLFKNRDFDIFF